MRKLELIRSLYLTHIAQAKSELGAQPSASDIAEYIIANEPADSYVYGHLGSYEPVIEELIGMGKNIIRYYNFSVVRPEAANWYPATTNYKLFKFCQKYDLFLKGPTGEILQYFAYGNPYMVDWSKWTPDLISDFLAEFIFLPWEAEIDMAELDIRTWMILDAESKGITQGVLDELVDQVTYRDNFKTFVKLFYKNALGPFPKDGFLNSSSRHEDTWVNDGYLCFFENATHSDRYDDEAFDVAIERWVENDHIIEIREPEITDPPAHQAKVWSRARYIVNLWEQNGGRIWANNERLWPTGLLYWLLAIQKRVEG